MIKNKNDFDIKKLQFNLDITNKMIMAYLQARQNTPHTEHEKHNQINKQLTNLYNKKYELLKIINIEQMTENIKNYFN